jgi:serine/threonine-protein kinase
MSSGGAIKGRYEKRQVLGEGGMGVVYRAFDTDLKREVALKTLRDGGDELALEMFRKECGVLASLNHPNIVDIYDVGQFEEDGIEKPYFVMPLLPGTTLDRIIKNEPQRLTVDRTVEIIAQTCRGLHAAHERGLIHRDLKPSNIFVLADDSVKIIDFGIAHLTGTHTSLGLKGTVYYMAPEQMEMKPASAQSDIYSLGVVCFEIFGRRRPFIGSNRDDVIRAILRAAPPPIYELNPMVSHQLSQVIHAALAKKPYHRYQTSREFATACKKPCATSRSNASIQKR